MNDQDTVALLVLLALVAKTTKVNPDKDKLVKDSIEISKIFMEEMYGKRK